jgi:hypothetical protein
VGCYGLERPLTRKEDKKKEKDYLNYKLIWYYKCKYNLFWRFDDSKGYYTLLV